MTIPKEPEGATSDDAADDAAPTSEGEYRERTLKDYLLEEDASE